MTRTRFISPVFSPNSDIGFVIPGGLLNFFEVGSTTARKDTFPIVSGGTANDNPVEADTVGRFPEMFFEGLANVVLTDADENQIWARDNVSPDFDTDPFLLADGSAATPSYSYTNDPDTGNYLAPDSVIGTTVGGAQVGGWSVNGLDVTTVGEIVTPSLILEGDTTTGWRQSALDAWAFSSASQDMLTLQQGQMVVTGRTDASAVMEIKALTGQISLIRGSGADISHGLNPSDAYHQIEPISGTDGGTLGTGASDGDATALLFNSIIGVTNPTDTTPAIQFRVGKSDGSTGADDLDGDETAFSLANFNGAEDIWTVDGTGNSTVPVEITVASNMNVTNGDVVIASPFTNRGIDFSAAAGGTGTVLGSILSLYEEGTFIPEVWDDSLNDEGSTYNLQEGFYRKIGDRVFFSLEIEISTKGALTGVDQLKIGPLPYTSSNASINQISSTYTGVGRGYVITAGTNPMGSVPRNTNYVNMFMWDSAGGTNELTIDDITLFTSSGEALNVSGHYLV